MFITGVNDTGDKLFSQCSLMSPRGYSGTWGKLIHEKMRLKISCQFSFNSARKMSGQLVKTVIITALGWLEKRNEEEATFLQGDKLWDSFMNNSLL